MATIHSLFPLLALILTCHGYVDFGDATRVRVVPSIPIPRPHQLPEGWQMPHVAAQHPMITAVAPFLTQHNNGSHAIYWSTTYHQYSRRFQNARGVFKRQNGVFQSDASLLATCTPCGSGASNSTRTATDFCYPTTNTGILNGAAEASSGSLCYGSNYAGALQPTSTSTGLPCCPTCTPISNTTVSITTGVLATTTTTATDTATDNTTTTITQITSTTVTLSATVTESGGTTTTIIFHTSTLPPVTISTTTIIATVTGSTTSPIVTVAPNTVIGCGTASGSGTIIGTGTVYVGPGGLFPVYSTGTVTGFASQVVGCGTIIATSGSFHGSATILGCGTGTGCAALTGVGTVYPDILGGLIGISSSGTITGCGRVIGCGTLDGSGTFFVDSPYTTTQTPAPPRPTVNIYISYCPPDPILAPFRIGMSTNHTAEPQQPGSGTYYANDTSAPTHTAYPFPPLSNLTLSRNATLANTTMANPLCQLCPSDSGICCPLYAACGADGHCPYTALKGSGYLKCGVNVVDSSNSSSTIGMIPVEGRKAPGLPGRRVPSPSLGLRRRRWEEDTFGIAVDHGRHHGHEFGFGLGRLRWRR